MKENISLKEKIGDILKRIADRVMAFFKGDKALGQAAHNRYAQLFLEDVQALRDMAELVSRGFDKARETEREYGEVKAGARFSKIYGIPKNNPFPPYKKSKSDAHELAIRWAQRDDVKIGDWKLAIYRQRWYIIEKFDNIEFEYQVIKCVPQKEFNEARHQWEEQYGRRFEKEMESLQDEIGYLNRATTSDGERRTNIDDNVSEYTGENYKILRLDTDENGKSQNTINFNGDNAHSNSVGKGQRDLIAVHNLSEEKLLKSLKLGGLPMPSIAVTKHDSQHTGFGEISLIFGKDTINPDVKSDNKVYGGDAWTPMYPNVEYEADPKKAAD